jgi:hypothetical protein
LSDDKDKEKTVAVYIHIPEWSHSTWADYSQLNEGEYTLTNTEIPGGIGDRNMFAVLPDEVKVRYINRK